MHRRGLAPAPLSATLLATYTTQNAALPGHALPLNPIAHTIGANFVPLSLRGVQPPKSHRFGSGWVNACRSPPPPYGPLQKILCGPREQRATYLPPHHRDDPHPTRSELGERSRCTGQSSSLISLKRTNAERLGHLASRGCATSTLHALARTLHLVDGISHAKYTD